MWDKLGEPVVVNIPKADPEQEAAEDSAGRAAHEGVHVKEFVKNTVVGMVGDRSRVVTYTEGEPITNTMKGVVGSEYVEGTEFATDFATAVATRDATEDATNATEPSSDVDTVTRGYGTVSGMSTKGFVMVEDAKYVVRTEVNTVTRGSGTVSAYTIKGVVGAMYVEETETTCTDVEENTCTEANSVLNTIRGVVGDMSRVVTYTGERPLEKPLEKPPDDDTEAGPAQAVSRLCLDGKSVFSGAQQCSVRELP
jgi:hypothetical protein